MMNTDFTSRLFWPALATAVALGFLAASGCGVDGVNLAIPFRVVLIEPTPFSTSVPCTDTIRVTFNGPIDTNAVVDPGGIPDYFLAQISPGGSAVQFDGADTFLSNSGRTLNLPFTFNLPSASYEFTFSQAQGENGERLEAAATTSFETAPSGPDCP